MRPQCRSLRHPLSKTRAWIATSRLPLYANASVLSYKAQSFENISDKYRKPRRETPDSVGEYLAHSPSPAARSSPGHTYRCAAVRSGADFTTLSHKIDPPKPGQARIVVFREQAYGGLFDEGWDVKLVMVVATAAA